MHVSQLLYCSVENREYCVVPDLCYANTNCQTWMSDHIHMDESVRSEWYTISIVSPVHCLRAEIEALLTSFDIHDRSICTVLLICSSVRKQRWDQVRWGRIMDGCADSAMTASKPHTINGNSYRVHMTFLFLQASACILMLSLVSFLNECCCLPMWVNGSTE